MRFESDMILNLDDIASNITYALGLSFDSVIYVDVDTEIYYLLYKDDNGQLQVKKSEDYSAKARQQINKVVHKDFYEEVKDLYSPSDVKNLLQEESTIESTHLRWNGSEYRWVRMTIQAAERIDGEVTKVIFAFKDVNENKIKELTLNAKLHAALEEAKKAYEAKSQFLSNISHDLRTPMKAIMGISTLMKSKDNIDKIELMEYLERIDLASENMLDLINSILDMSKAINSNIKLSKYDYSISALLKDIETIISVQAKEKKQKLVINNNSEYDNVRIDVVKLRQIIMNVLSNSVKYTDEEGKIYLNVSNDGNIFNFSIKDNGIGMSKEFVKNIYQPFERETRTRYIDGVGLGMSIVKKYVELFKGTIDIESAVGEGTCVTIKLPLEIIEKIEEKQQDTIVSDKKDYSDYNILVVEDNEINLFILKEVLSPFGCSVDVAMDGLEAIAKVAGSKDHYYDLIIMDMKMPNMDGDIATRNIRLLDNRDDVKTMPIIMASADAAVINQEEVYANGINGYVIKPIDQEKVKNILDKYLC